MAYMCLACSEVYNDNFDVCPKAHCNGGLDAPDDIIYVDDVFAPVLAEFNKKGYQIDYAEFGNPNNSITNCPVIIFSDYFWDVLGDDGTADLFKYLLKPWEFKIEDGHPIIYCSLFGSNSMDRYIKLLNAHISLADFVSRLDYLDI